jgi:uncharacterized protein (DUF58 family)
MIGTRRLYFLLALITILFSLSFSFTALAKIGFAGNVIILFLILIDLWLTPKTSLLIAHRKVPERLSIGRDNRAQLYLENTGVRTLTCQLRDDFPQYINAEPKEFHFTISGSQAVLLPYSLKPNERGSYKFGDIYLRYQSTLGLFWRQVKFKAEQTVKVYSDLHSLQELSAKLSCSSELGELHKNKRGQGTDFASLKDYVSGDDSKNIDWKATARFHRPIVRTYEIEQEQRLLVLIDAGRMMLSELSGLSRFDHALNAALSLILTGLANHDQAGIGIFADRPLMYLPPRRGRGYLTKILEATYSVQPIMIEPDYTGMLAHFAQLQKGRSFVVILTDLTDASGSKALLAGLSKLNKRHLTLCVTLKDKQVELLANATYMRSDHGASLAVRSNLRNAREIETSSIFQRAVAIDLVHERELAFSILRRSGCLILDQAPEDLTSKLIDKYLEVKSKGLI